MRPIRLLRYALVAVLALVLVAAAMANRGLITVQALPSEFADFLGWNVTVEVPVFLVILGSAVVGLILGFVWEWLREGKHRKAERTGQRHVTALAREVSKLREQHGQKKDDVLALLDGPAKR
jgi:lipopolysaccharide assembly protein A